MDLVKSYDSEMDDDSDIEEISISPSKGIKNVDVIELDSDSESETVVEKTKTVNNRVVSERSSSNLHQVEVDCIDLENTPEKRCQTIETPEVSLDSSKKIDYLNLEDSDSDIECENVDKSVTNLMDTASILSDKPSGPQKPSDTTEYRDQVAKNKSHEVSVSNTGIDSNYNTPRSTPDFVYNSASHDSTENSLLEPSSKHFKGPSPLEIDHVQDDLDNFNTDKNLSCIFRDDSRIIEASKKNILCRIPRQIIQTHNAHTSVITSVGWCIPKFSYLYLSAAQDGLLKIWDLYRKTPVQCINPQSGLNAAKWSLDGGQIIAGGVGKKAYVFDVQTGKKIVHYEIYNVIASMEVHPYMEDVFLCGTRNAVLGFDIRVNTGFPIRSYFSKCEEVLDLVFLDENEFICSTNIVSHDSADRTIMAWDFSSGAILSNQIYLERYTCPSLKVHPTDSSFIAQTNGNYIAAFSASRPYKMKNKRYTGHKVSGYGIECEISPDGKYVVSGDVGGSLYFYNYSNTNTVLVTPQRKVPTNRVKWHPTLPSTLITSTYDGQIHIWK